MRTFDTERDLTHHSYADKSPLSQLVSHTLQAIGVLLFFAFFTFFLAGCAYVEPRVAITQPTTAPPVAVQYSPPTTGAIYSVGQIQRPFFEDVKPSRVGDVLTIAIVEKTSASRSSKSSAAKTADAKAAIPTMAGLPGKYLGPQLSANSGNTFEGKGETANDNTFTGTLTVTVVAVLPNGNLVVAGEKQIGINQNTELIRFSGVVNPLTIQAGNVVQSPQVADARLEYRGKGYIDEAQRMGWLQRFFLNILPF